MTESNLIRRGGVMSLIIGTPIGILLLCSWLILSAHKTDEGALMILALPLFLGSQGLLISFVLVLWLVGRKATTNLLKGQSLLWVLVKYSATIGLVMGGLISGILILSMAAITGFLIFASIFIFAKILLPVLMTLLGTLVASFIIGIIVCNVIKWQISKNRAPSNDGEIH